MVENGKENEQKKMTENSKITDNGNNAPKKKHYQDVVFEEGDNARFISHDLEILNLGNIDLWHSTEEQVCKRISDYFEICRKNDMKPCLAGFALAMGVSRVTLWKYANDIIKLPQQASNPIKKGYQILTSQMENWMQNGKINPVAGIFLSKNNYGYRDQTEQIIQVNNPLGEINVAEVKQKYLDTIPEIEQ